MIIPVRPIWSTLARPRGIMVRHLSSGKRGRNNYQQWIPKNLHNWTREMTPFSKGLAGGVVIGLMFLPLTNFMIIGGLCYGAYAWFKRRQRPTSMFNPFASKSDSLFSKSPFPFDISKVGIGIMHQLLKTMLPNIQNLARVESALKDKAQDRIRNNAFLRERLGDVLSIHGPIAQELVQTNNNMKLKVQYQVHGTHRSGIVGIAAKVMDPISIDRNSPLQHRIQLKNMTLNLGGRLEKVPLDEHHQYEDIVIDAEVVDVKSSSDSSDRFKR
jgi:hypothetical protein